MDTFTHVFCISLHLWDVQLVRYALFHQDKNLYKCNTLQVQIGWIIKKFSGHLPSYNMYH